MKARTSVDIRRALLLAGALVGVATALGACIHNDDLVMTADIPGDYRLRHPIVVEESNQSIVVFVGRGGGGLTAEQRADVVGLAQGWFHEATGAIIADVPVGTPNARAAAGSFREIQSLLASVGVPSRSVVAHRYHPADPRHMPAIRLSYARISAEAGPCGVWPEDIGPSIKNKSYFENKQYFNFGCSYQRNMTAMVANPSDLVQPRAETPPYTIRRSEAFEKYRKGNPTTTIYPEGDKAKLSDVGK